MGIIGNWYNWRFGMATGRYNWKFGAYGGVVCQLFSTAVLLDCLHNLILIDVG